MVSPSTCKGGCGHLWRVWSPVGVCGHLWGVGSPVGVWSPVGGGGHLWGVWSCASLLVPSCPRYSPVGVFFLIVGKLMVLSDLGGTLTGLAMYMVTVLVGLVVHSCIVLPLVYLVVARRNPLKLVYGVLQALLTALATSSRLIACCVACCVAMDT